MKLIDFLEITLKKPDQGFKINETSIEDDYPTYFIADVAANHDGDIERAKDLIYLAAEKGANGAKFEHFSASTIVSDLGFKALNCDLLHQFQWSIFCSVNPYIKKTTLSTLTSNLNSLELWN